VQNIRTNDGVTQSMDMYKYS